MQVTKKERKEEIVQKNTKEWIQYGSALGMLASGVCLVFLCFFFNNYDLKDSVLWYVGQCLVYAGSVFGIKAYINSKYGDIKTFVEKEIKKEEQEHEHEKY